MKRRWFSRVALTIRGTGRHRCLDLCLVLAAVGSAAHPARAAVSPRAVGYNEFGQRNMHEWSGMVAGAAGWYHTVGVKSDGSVVAVGQNTYGQYNVGGWSGGMAAVAARYYHTVGLQEVNTPPAVFSSATAVTVNEGTTAGVDGVWAVWRGHDYGHTGRGGHVVRGLPVPAGGGEHGGQQRPEPVGDVRAGQLRGRHARNVAVTVGAGSMPILPAPILPFPAAWPRCALKAAG